MFAGRRSAEIKGKHIGKQHYKRFKPKSNFISWDIAVDPPTITGKVHERSNRYPREIPVAKS